MANKIKIDNEDLLVLLEFDDEEYKNIIMCLDKNNEKVFIINNKIIKDREIIDKINQKYALELPDTLNGIVF